MISRKVVKVDLWGATLAVKWPMTKLTYLQRLTWVTEANMGLLMQTCPCIVSPSYTPLLYRKTGVHYFLNFALKHRLWVF